MASEGKPAIDPPPHSPAGSAGHSSDPWKSATGDNSGRPATSGGTASTGGPGTSGSTDHAGAFEILSQIDLFSDLPQEHLRRVAEIGVEEQYRSGATIFSEGDPGEVFYVILSGAVRISRIVPGMGEEALAVLKRGAYFGEMSLIDDAPRSATAICHESCRLFVLGRRDLEDLLFIDRDLAYELLWNWVRTLSRRLRATNDKMAFLATTSKF